MYHEHEARVWATRVAWRDKVAHVDIELVLGAVVLLGLALWSADASAMPIVHVPFELGPVAVLLAAAATLPRARLGIGRGERTITFDATGAVLLSAAVLLRPEWFPLVALAASLRAERWRTVLNTCVRTTAIAAAAIVFHSYVALFATVTSVRSDVQHAAELVLAGVTIAVVEAVLYRRHLRAVDDLAEDASRMMRAGMLRDAPSIALGCVSVVLLTVGPVMLLLVVPLAGLVAASLRDQEKLHESVRDYKTGLLSMQGFGPQAGAELARARRHGRPLVMLFMDLDGLKSVNTALGFLAGESVIRTLGDILRENRREEDLVARVGGDEFALLLPDTDLAGGLAFAERLRAAVAATPLNATGTTALHRTASVGLATLSPNDSLEDLMDRADRGLRRAKEQGRNRVVVMGPQPARLGTDDTVCG
ncbi:MAG TPA: GGDEF domain-containing protein [Candidatus Nanopelagicales bacterium]|nr:GGDEF domain-containing protein [Candidatus Nanopelagicales bacterium]